MTNIVQTFGGIGPLLAGAAIIALAVLTVVIIVVNWRLLRRTRISVEAAKTTARVAEEAVRAANREAHATKDATEARMNQFAKVVVDASRDQLEAMKKQVAVTVASLNEMILAREMQWRPVLVWKNLSSFPPTQPLPDAITVQNLGRGAAIRCLYVGSYPVAQDWYQGPLDWRRSEVFDLRAGDTQTPAADRQTEPLPNRSVFEGADGHLQEAICCQDEFGNIYRFVSPKPNPEVWRGGDREPGWVQLYRALISPA